MKIRHLLAASVGISIFASASAATAATILIDDFVATQRVEDVVGADGTPPRTSEIAAATAIGGFRDLAALNDDGNVGGTTAEVTGAGNLSVNNQASTSGDGTITWDGNDFDASETAIDTDGLGGLDLTAGGVNGRFVFDVLSADFPFDFEMTIFDDDSSDSVSGTISGGIFASTPQAILFSSFTGIDFTNVGAIQLAFSGLASGDLLINRIDAVTDTPNAVPVPMPLALMAGSLIGLGLLSSSRKKLHTA